MCSKKMFGTAWLAVSVLGVAFRGGSSSLARVHFDGVSMPSAGMLRKIVYPAILAASLLSVGCASLYVDNLQKSDSFSDKSLLAGGLFVGGISLSNEPSCNLGKDPSAGNIYVDAQGSDAVWRYAFMLEEDLRNKGPEVDIKSVTIVHDMLGNAEHARILCEMECSSMLSPESLDQIKRKLIGAQYVVFGRLLTDFPAKNCKTEEKVTKDGKKMVHIKMIAERTTTYGFVFYDIKSGRRVWSGHISASLNNVNEYEMEEEEKSGFLGLLSDIEKMGKSNFGEITQMIVDAVLDKEGNKVVPKFPPAPSTDDVSDTVFGRLGSSIF